MFWSNFPNETAKARLYRVQAKMQYMPAGRDMQRRLLDRGSYARCGSLTSRISQSSPRQSVGMWCTNGLLSRGFALCVNAREGTAL